MPITRTMLRAAHSEGGGFCMFCGEREDDLPSPYINECSNCGHPTVVPATMILTFLAWVEEGDEDEER